MGGKVHFGIYELDRDAMELRKQGVLIRLQEQPFRVLASLVDRPGEIVTREELQDRIWDKETFVDFEQSLNKAVNRLREALNDDAARPRYVETIPRRGYRFVAPVTSGSPSESGKPHTFRNAELALERRKTRSRRSITALVVIAIGVIMAGLWRSWQHKSTTSPPRHVTSAAFCCPTLSRDGKLLAYVSGVEGGVPHIWVQQSSGSEAILRVTDGPDADAFPDFSPDGAHIVFWSSRGGGGIYVAPTFGGDAKLVTKAKFEAIPRFSPKGDVIIYWDDFKAVSISTNTGERKELAFNQDFVVKAPRVIWSPDGDKVLFYGMNKRDPQQQSAYWSVPVISTEARRLVLPTIDQIEGDSISDWARDEKGNEWIIYFASKQPLWKLLRVRVSSEGQIFDEPQQLGSGTGLINWGGSLSTDGKLTYLTYGHTNSIYEVAFSREGRKLDPVFQIPLPPGRDYRSPSASRDGRWMAYEVSGADNSRSVLLRDLTNGEEKVLDEKGSHFHGDVAISPDGSKVIVAGECNQNAWREAPNPCGFLLTENGATRVKICESCTARGFSSDGSSVLIQKYHRAESDKRPPSIVKINLTTGTETDFLSASDASLYHAFFSWDDHWVIFKKVLSEKSQLLMTRVRNGVRGKEAEWIAITDGNHSDDKPQFSPDGNTVYFTSTRDGYLCIWAQRLDPMTKHPVGPPFTFEHFHNSTGSAGVNNQTLSDFSVAGDKMLINLPQVHTDIWMSQVE